MPSSFEVEIGGKLTGPVAAVRYVFLVAPEPCTIDNLGTVKTIAIGEGRRKSGGLTYWTEGNVREGSKGYACAAALDARGRAVGFGVYARNPLVFSAGGKGELEMGDVDIVLARLSPARALPAQRF